MTTKLAGVREHPVFTEKRYLDFERYAGERYEFVDGSVYAMAGESPDHSTICFNLHGTMRNQLRGSRYRGFSPNMKIATSDPGLFSYPDLAVVCGTPTSAWLKTEISGLDAVLRLASISSEISLAELYDLIEFPAE